MIKKEITPQFLNQFAQSTMVAHLGIVCTDVGKDYLCASMPVDHRTSQPMGILHGGASVVLAETLGSLGSFACINTTTHHAVGLEVNANHLRPVMQGTVHGKATLIHEGKKTHVWDIRIVNDEKKLVCISRLTIAIVEKIT